MTGPIKDFYAKYTCRMGKGISTCRYLAVGGQGFCCLKGTRFAAAVDARAAAKTMTAQADNCPGWALVTEGEGLE